MKQLTFRIYNDGTSSLCFYLQLPTEGNEDILAKHGVACVTQPLPT